MTLQQTTRLLQTPQIRLQIAQTQPTPLQIQQILQLIPPTLQIALKIPINKVESLGIFILISPLEILAHSPTSPWCNFQQEEPNIKAKLINLLTLGMMLALKKFRSLRLQNPKTTATQKSLL